MRNLTRVAGDNRVRGRDLSARDGVAARGEHVHGPRAVARAPPRGLPHAVLRAHAAPAEGHGPGWSVHMYSVYTFCSSAYLFK